MTVLDDHTAEILLSPAQVLSAVADIERRSALLALAVRRLEASGDYATSGAVSINAWLREHARMTTQRAGDLVSTGRFLDTYPAFADAAVSGRLSGSQIDIARRLNRHKYATALAAHQSELVELLAEQLRVATGARALPDRHALAPSARAQTRPQPLGLGGRPRPGGRPTRPTGEPAAARGPVGPAPASGRACWERGRVAGTIMQAASWQSGCSGTSTSTEKDRVSPLR